MVSYRDDALARLDVAAFFSGLGVQLRRLNDTEYQFLCPFHDDKNPSANVAVQGESKGLWFCHACGAKGTPIDFVMNRDRLTYKDALVQVGAAAGMQPPGKGNGAAGPARPAPASKLSEENVAAWHEAALRNPDLMRWFAEKRGYTPDTVVAWQLGWDGQRVTIPIRDERQRLVNVRRYKRDSKGSEGKMIGLEPGLNEARLFPLVSPVPDEVLLVEGEWDAILMHQQGFRNAMTVTSGAGTWNPSFTPWFEDRKVTIIYDNDDAGRKGAQRVAAILSGASQVTICHLPGLPERGDLTDFFVEQQRGKDELTNLIIDAAPFVSTPLVVDEPPPVRVPLHQASHAKYRGQRLEMSVMLSGKATTPYTIPYEFEFTCGMNNKRYCGACSMMEANGHRTVRVSASDAATLALINVTSSSQYSALRALAKAHPQCGYGIPTIVSSTNVEEMRLIRELDDEEAMRSEAESEYVNRTGFFVGHGLLPNRSYTMRGYTHPHPKTQATVHVINEAIPSQDNIASFTVTPEVNEALRVFENGDPEDRWRRIYDDLRMHVHRIQDRFDMQIAYDLAFHSIIDFYFNGAYVRRGWVEVMVMGDSGQGKTEMALALLHHYRLGERIQAEQSSVAGLLGGLEKLGDAWMLSWGRLPLNDKRLVVIDETQGLKPDSVESLSDVRATGIAEITKIRTERTHSRCRLIWLANPPSGMPLGQHNQGVQSIRDLFKKPEDIRRLDLAIAVASGDVDFARAINVRHKETGEPVYTSDLCRLLVLWAWSRRSEQVVFTSEATDAILSSATDMGRRYHPAIPLVEPADQRLKLARLAAAAAARVHSTDEAGEKLIVDVQHVSFVTDFLDRVYNATSMAYGEFSAQQRAQEELSETDEAEIRREIELWSNADQALLFFRQAGIFKKSELTDVIGWDEAYAKLQVKFLAAKRLIRPTREGFRKNAVFIGLLRRMLAEQHIVVDDDDDLSGGPF